MLELPRFEDLREDEVSKMLGDFLRMVIVMTPLSVIVTLAFVLTESAVWRVSTFTAMVVALTVTAIVLVRARRRGRTLTMRPSVLAIMAAAQLVGVVITGGVESPFIPETIITGVILAMFLPSSWASFSVAMQIVVLAVLTPLQAMDVISDALPQVFGGGARAGSPALAWVRGASTIGFLYFALVGGRRVKQTFEAVGRSALRSRDEALASYAEESRTLTIFVGEIAHELKNPLATIKGLSALVARDLEQGKNAERMAILRRETERMQTVLDEFLNFSRPVVPLAEHVVALEPLCLEVARLHEGMVGERALRLEVRVAADLAARCDRRKIKQVLINLIQNAIAASPDGASIVLRGASSDGSIDIEVIDEGPGVPPEIERSVFEAGVTSKPGGSGFGLTVSRALARQHGGDVAIRSTKNGCTAILTLPHQAAESVPSGEAA